MEQKCPWCGETLPGKAAFCPHCARVVRPKKIPKQPVPLLKKLLGLLALAVVIAVRLDNVPTDVALNFQGSVFRDNGQNIVNSCDQPLDTSQAIFE